MTPVLSEVLQVVEPFKTLLSVSEEGDYIIVKPKQYIADQQTYSDIGRAMHTVNAEYMREHKNIHWRILKAEANPKLSLAVNHIQKAQELMIQALQELKEAGY